jgi:hypothetical protein
VLGRDLGGEGKGWGCCGGRKHEAGEAGKECLSFGFLRVLIDPVGFRMGGYVP